MPAPCDLLPETPPAVADRLSAPTAETLLPQLLQLTPRGPAWGTDEAGAVAGASPGLAKLWTWLAGSAAAAYVRLTDQAMQVMPSGITWSLSAWEIEYGLPDPCLSPTASAEDRRRAVHMRFRATGGASPAYFACLARTLGHDVTIVEPSDFIVDTSECDGDDTVVLVNGHHEWLVTVGTLGDIWFYADDGLCDDTPLEGFSLPGDLECLLRREAPAHTTLILQAV